MSNFLDRVVDLAIRQRNSLKNILFDSQWFIFWILVFNGLLFSFIGVDGYHSFTLWLVCFLCVVNLLRNAINASEVGL